ncbi:MAG: tRNA (adenosine(37)-N6)-threonylcarbamoyltransferase complex transferase subunit TsaD [Candidatus Nealsonbacteria bacterium]|nr:MAG: tRNA (adenosine(37)-N6)-threonylcarbamoyltransferase complex transferase subunit TsaD [Candidatus Nealsonbacteria bacterium]
MKILAIDTSCDDTCISLTKVKNGKLEILSNIISSQVKLHAKYGGVYPSLAKREHQKNLPTVLKKALKKAKSASRRTKIDLIGVTTGPGLEPCLWMGVNFAKELAKKSNLKIIPINHIEAHILANWLPPIHKIQNPKSKNQNLFPAICLVISGGHTQLILMKEVGKYKILGETRDDAAGECFDKVAKILGLGYPGGPAIDASAAKARSTNYGNNGSPTSIILPRPMIYQKNYDFSFSGLKTAVLYDFRSRSPKIRKSKIYIQEMCFETQQAIIDVLIKKTIRAAKNYQAKSIILGGGVAASEELRSQFKTKCLTSDVKFLVPPKIFCTDNAAMVGVTAFYHKNKATFNWEKIEANANLKI